MSKRTTRQRQPVRTVGRRLNLLLDKWERQGYIDVSATAPLPPLVAKAFGKKELTVALKVVLPE